MSELCKNDRTEITPNPKDLRVVLHSMGLANCKPAPTPSAAGSIKHKPDDDVDMDIQVCRLYMQSLSTDRCDLQFETKACATEMKHPTEVSWTRLKRLARYSAGTQSARSVLMTPGTDYDTHTKRSCEPGRTVIGLEMPRTRKVNRV